MEHPLQQFVYCPKCGASEFRINNFKSKVCDNCRFVYYFNPSASVAAFIFNERGELLVCKRKDEPAKGTYDLPGGFVDMGENAEEAVLREVEEETGIQLRSVEFLYSLPNIYCYSGFDVHTLDLFFRGTADKTENPEANDDVEESFFVPVADLKPELFGLGSIRKAVERFLNREEGRKV